MWGLMTAEEMGITSANLEEMKGSEDVQVQRFLGVSGDNWGYEELGLDADAMAQMIAAVGNYAEIYDRNITALGIPRGQNSLWTDGGLLYAPPFR
jgi:general L-amino acid transport system substrate-binding protein